MRTQSLRKIAISVPLLSETGGPCQPAGQRVVLATLCLFLIVGFRCMNSRQGSQGAGQARELDGGNVSRPCPPSSHAHVCPLPNELCVLRRNAKTITAHWRAIIDRVLGKEVAVPEGMTEVEFNDAVKQAERAPQVHTWRQLFLTCKQIEDEKLERFGKRSREQAQELQAGKRRVQEAAETLNARPQKLLASASSASSAFSAPSSTSSSSSSSSQAAGSSGPTSVRAKYLRELGHDRAKELAKRTKLIPATRPVPPNLKSTASHRVLKTSSGAVMKIPRAFDPARRPR